MPIVIDRHSLENPEPPKLTPEQSQRAWEAILRAYIQSHPEGRQG